MAGVVCGSALADPPHVETTELPRKEEGMMSRRIRAKLLLLAAGVSLLSLAAAQASASGGVSPDQLTAAGWTCFLDPAAPRTVCSDPGHGRPVPGGAPSYNVKLFTLDGAFIGTSHLIRADLYHGEPCPQTGGLYLFIPPLGYYRCEHF
jgi:hypothetical protein